MTDAGLLEEVALEAWTRAMRALHEVELRAEVDWMSPMSVYADALQAVGDVRGELIALDLWERRSSGARAHSELEKRDALTTAWLGKLSQHPDLHHRLGLLRFRLTSDSYDLLERVLESSAGRHVEAIHVDGSMRLLDCALQRLLDHGKLPWLGRLSLTLREETAVNRYAVSSSRAEGLAACAPNLHTLEVDGHQVLERVHHPQLSHLVVTGHSSLSTDAVCESVASVDFAFQAVDAGNAGVAVPPEVLGKLLRRSQFPRLRRLNLSRNEPGYRRPQHLGGAVDVFKFAASLELIEQIEWLQLPTIRMTEDALSLQSCLDRAPSLARIKVRDWYGPAHQFTATRAALEIPIAKPWIPRDEVDPNIVLHVSFDGMTRTASLLELCHVMERHYSEMEASARSQWDVIWSQIRLLFAHASDQVPLSGDSLGEALESCALHFVDDTWSRLARDASRLRSAPVAVIRLAALERAADV